MHDCVVDYLWGLIVVRDALSCLQLRECLIQYPILHIASTWNDMVYSSCCVLLQCDVLLLSVRCKARVMLNWLSWHVDVPAALNFAVTVQQSMNPGKIETRADPGSRLVGRPARGQG